MLHLGISSARNALALRESLHSRLKSGIRILVAVSATSKCRGLIPRLLFYLGAYIGGYRTECVSAPIIHCRCSAGMWNSLQTIPEPYSSGALSFRLRLLEADANNPST